MASVAGLMASPLIEPTADEALLHDRRGEVDESRRSQLPIILEVLLLASAYLAPSRSREHEGRAGDRGHGRCNDSEGPCQGARR